jgi:hypothetical protein
VVPLAERKPVVVLFGSLGVWLFASSLAQWLPSAYAEGWSFNPFAWQLMFALGILARVQPISAEFHDSKTALWMTRAAIVVFLTFAFAKLFLETQAPPGYMKQNLASLRIVSFVVIAWLFARAVHAGWIKALAKSLPSVVNIGKQGLVCFIAGACMSLVIDTALRLVSFGQYQWIAGLSGDAVAIGSLIWLAAFWRDRKETQRARLPKQQPVPAHATHRRDR